MTNPDQNLAFGILRPTPQNPMKLYPVWAPSPHVYLGISRRLDFGSKRDYLSQAISYFYYHCHQNSLATAAATTITTAAAIATPATASLTGRKERLRHGVDEQERHGIPNSQLEDPILDPRVQPGPDAVQLGPAPPPGLREDRNTIFTAAAAAAVTVWRKACGTYFQFS